MPRFFGLCLWLAVAAAAAGADDRAAKRAFRDAQQHERAGRLREAFDAYSRAAELQPREPRYILQRELARQRAAFQHAHAGVRLMRKSLWAEAVRELEKAHGIDASNDFVREQLARAREAAGVQQAREVPSATAAERFVALGLSSSGADLAPPLALHPRAARRSWNLRGDSRALYLAIGAAYGIQFQFDDSLPSTTVHFRLDDADFATALHVLTTITKTFVAPLEERAAIVATDSTQKRQEFERVVVKSIEVSDLSTPEEVNEIANVLRTLLDMPQVQPSLQRRVITIRGPGSKVLAAERLIRQLAAGRPEAFIEVEAVEVHSQRARELGLVMLPQSSLFKLTPDKARVQTGVAAPLPQVFGRAPAMAGAAPAAPLGVFGGGHTTFGITLPGADFRAKLSQSLVRGISAQSVRALDSQPATLLIGERYPIINASFSPIFFSGSVEQQQQQGTLVNPFPSFTFEDLGIRLRITPRIHADGDVSMKIEAQVRSLTGQNLNGLPTISNRQTEQVVRVPSGQPALIIGVVLKDERSSMSGTPLLSEAPVLGYLFGQRLSESSESEVIVVVTAHVFRDAPGPLEQRRQIYVPSNYVPIAN